MAGRYHTAASSAAATANSSSQSCIVSGFRLYQRFMGFSLLPCQRAIPAVDRAKVVHLPPRLGQQLRRYGAALPAAAADNDRVAVGRQVRQLLFQPVQRNIARTGDMPRGIPAGVRTSHKMARCCISCRACAGVMRFWFLIQFAPLFKFKANCMRRAKVYDIIKPVYDVYILRQHRTIPALRLKHRSGSCGTASALPKCSIMSGCGTRIVFRGKSPSHSATAAPASVRCIRHWRRSPLQHPVLSALLA